MATNQTLLWVVLPNGLTGEGADRLLKLSLFITPRLRTDEGQTLAHFPDFLDWPARMQPGQAAFMLETDNGVQVEATLAGSAPELALWKALFGVDTPLKPFEFDDFADRPIVTYPVRQVLNYIKSRYRELAAHSPDDLPAVARGEDDPEDRRVFLGELFQDLAVLHADYLHIETEADLSTRLQRSLEAARDEARARRAAGQRGGSLIEPAG
ncbi:MAG: hypothetical protein ACK2UK_01085, partial [Candidatus Promineifilaceae bacterium]